MPFHLPSVCCIGLLLGASSLWPIAGFAQDSSPTASSLEALGLRETARLTTSATADRTQLTSSWVLRLNNEKPAASWHGTIARKIERDSHTASAEAALTLVSSGENSTPEGSLSLAFSATKTLLRNSLANTTLRVTLGQEGSGQSINGQLEGNIERKAALLELALRGSVRATHEHTEN